METSDIPDPTSLRGRKERDGGWGWGNKEQTDRPSLCCLLFSTETVVCVSSHLGLHLAVFSPTTEKIVCCPSRLLPDAGDRESAETEAEEMTVRLFTPRSSIRSKPKKFKRTLIYFSTDAQYANLRGNPL